MQITEREKPIYNRTSDIRATTAIFIFYGLIRAHTTTYKAFNRAPYTSIINKDFISIVNNT